MGVVNNVSLQEESDPEKELRENRERELKEKMARKVRVLCLFMHESLIQCPFKMIGYYFWQNKKGLFINKH